MNLESRKALPSQVPCGKCRACCKSDRIILGRKDDPRAFKWHVEDGYAVLDRKANGECVYLTEQGCSVHDAQPDICKRFDCRVLVATTPLKRRVIRIVEKPSMAFVYAAGIERAHTLEG